MTCRDRATGDAVSIAARTWVLRCDGETCGDACTWKYSSGCLLTPSPLAVPDHEAYEECQDGDAR